MVLYFIVRPLEQALETKNRLTVAGIENCYILDALKIVFHQDSLDKVLTIYNNFNAIIVTSVNALYGLKTMREDFSDYKGKIYCVGKKTAQVAIQMGFKNIFTPMVENAKGMIESFFHAPREKILYLTTNEAKEHIESHLTQRKFDYERYNIYQMQSNEITLDLHSLLQNDGEKHFLCFSNLAFQKARNVIKDFILTKSQKKMTFWHIVSCEEEEKMVNSMDEERVEYYNSPRHLYSALFSLEERK